MFLHWRANLADQNKQQPLKINIRVTYHTVLSVWNKPLIDTCQHCSTNQANQALRSLANAGFQNRGVCPQAFPSFPFPSPHFHFLTLVSFLTRPKPRIPFLGLSLLRNQTETLATQAITLPDIQDLLEPLENAISHMLIPSITDRKCNQLDRNILALPVRLGGLGLGNPSLEARREYASSVKVTKPLVEQIVSQSHQLPEDSLIKLAQQEVRSERSKEPNTGQSVLRRWQQERLRED